MRCVNKSDTPFPPILRGRNGHKQLQTFEGLLATFFARGILPVAVTSIVQLLFCKFAQSDSISGSAVMAAS